MLELINQLSYSLNLSPILIVLGFVWSFIWKLIALWYSARNNSKIWFIILALVNTLGLLEIIYIFLIANKDDSKRF